MTEYATSNIANAPKPQAVLPDFDLAIKHIALITGAKNPANATCVFQTFDDNKQRQIEHLASGRFTSDPYAYSRTGTIREHWGLLKRLNGLGVGVYITVNAIDPEVRDKRRNEHVVNWRSHWA